MKTSNELLLWASGLLGLILYLPFFIGVIRGHLKQNVATWMLWVLLDSIALISVVLQRGNYVLLLCYVIGNTIMTTALLYKGLFKWTDFETLVLSLVIICLVIWAVSGSRGATIASTIAVCISGLPQIRDSWREPDKTTALIYLGYVCVSILSFFGGKAWTIEDRFYPGMITLLCVAIAVAAFRNKQPKRSN